MNDCIFCKIAKGEKKAEVIAVSDNFMAFKDIDQSVRGHTLIITKKHHVTYLDIPNKLAEEMMKFTKGVISDLLDKRLGDGFNILMNNLPAGGQEVPHAHLHIIPRKEGDGIRFLTKK